MRYNPTEKLGMIEADRAVTKHLGWIFRPEPFVDVGIDAFIEKSEEGNPEGKFIAVQVKAGEGNFHLKSDCLTYYVSNIHYNYWTNLNVPIILVAYLPATDKCLWQVIDKRTLLKTKSCWKINIPLNNLLNKDSKHFLDKLLYKIETKNIFSELYKFDYDSDFSEEYEFFSEILISTSKINDIITEFGKYTNQSAAKNKNLAENGYTDNDPQVRGNIKQQSRTFASTSRRLINEVLMFSESFPEEIYIFGKYVYSTFTTHDLMPEHLKKQINQLPVNLERALFGIDELRTTAKTIPIRYPIMKKSRVSLVEALDLLFSEYTEAQSIANNLRN